MITKTTGKDFYYKDDIDFYVDTLAELEAMDVEYVPHASKAYVIKAGKTMILSGSGSWGEFYDAEASGGGSGPVPFGTIKITGNGKGIDVAEYAYADVEVPTSGGYSPPDNMAHILIDVYWNRTIPINLTTAVGAEVDWGDGDTSTTSTEASTLSHTYSEDGVYDIKITPASPTDKVGLGLSDGPQPFIDGGVSGTNHWKRSLVQKVFAGDVAIELYQESFYSQIALDEVALNDDCVLYSPDGGLSTFSHCYSLKSFDMKQLPNVAISMFNACYGLREVDLGDIKSIDSGGFSGCYSLVSVDIPSSVEAIGGSAFSGANSLIEMHVRPTTPPTLSATNAIPSGITVIYVPQSAVDNYKSATNWSVFAAKIQAESA